MNSEALESRVSTLEKLLLSQIERVVGLEGEKEVQRKQIAEQASRLLEYEQEREVIRRKVFEEGRWIEPSPTGGFEGVEGVGGGRHWAWLVSPVGAGGV